MCRLSNMFCWKRGTGTIRWLRMALRLLQLLGSRCLEVMLLRTANDTCRLLTWGGRRALDALESLFQKLNRNLDIVDFVCFIGDVGDLIGQYFNIGRVVARRIQWFVDWDTSSDNVFAELVDDDHDLANFVLHAEDVVADSLDLLVVVLNHTIVERDLLLETNDGMAQVGVSRRAKSLGMLARRSTH